MFENIDNKIRSNLDAISDGNSSYWSFQGNDKRHFTHNYFQYPAMMVPQMQGELIRAVRQIDSSIGSVFDPFVGSGTTLIESMNEGLSFRGKDINPLAVLLCRTKSEALNLPSILEAYSQLSNIIKDDSCTDIEVSFPNRDKWFRVDVSQELSKIRRSILKIDELQCRRFFWVALAETVRLTSNSRTSNFKLYTYPVEDIAKRQINPISIFMHTVQQNIGQLKEHIHVLITNDLLEHYKYKRPVLIELGDTKLTTQNVVSDLLVTSPPYGDNRTTVTYGQYSYLPLNWINLSDIDNEIDENYLISTQEIDRISLGGSLAEAKHAISDLSDMSSSFAQIIDQLHDQKPDRIKRVASFWRDFNQTLDPILSQLQPNGLMVWTVGNRRVGYKEVPMDEILEQLLNARGAYLIKKIDRMFPTNSKRMENISNTMSNEKVLVMRKGVSQ